MPAHGWDRRSGGRSGRLPLRPIDFPPLPLQTEQGNAAELAKKGATRVVSPPAYPGATGIRERAHPLRVRYRFAK